MCSGAIPVPLSLMLTWTPLPFAVLMCSVPPFGSHGVFGVQEKVQKHLLQFSRIAVDQRQSFMQVGYDFDVEGPELVLQTAQAFRRWFCLS